jgi:protein-S-isoprenylcysteine O-methyltransferase Ste14
MSDYWDSQNRSMTWAAIAFAAAFSLHGIDHLRRGMAASPPSIMIGGMIQGVVVVAAVVLVLRQHRWASEAAMVVGFGSAALFTYAHLLPTFLPSYQDSFTSGPRINVTWFSWLTAAGAIGTGLVLGYIALRARLTRRVSSR